MSKRPVIGMALVAAWALAVGVACGADGTEPQEEGTVEAMKAAPGGGGGGGGATYSCQCSDHVGTWTGSYSSQSAADADIKVYCRDDNGDGNYGSCTAGN